MSSPDEEEDEHDRQFKNICFNMGLALVAWQRVEDEHYALFCHLTGIIRQDLSSIIYHSTESFDARRVMMDHLARSFINSLTDKQQAEARRQLAPLNKALKDASVNRNKIAHYGVEYKLLGMTEHDDGSVSLAYGEPRLQPSEANILSRIQGRGPSDKEYDLGITELQTYRDDFLSARAMIAAFSHWLASAVTLPQQSVPPQSTEPPTDSDRG